MPDKEKVNSVKWEESLVWTLSQDSWHHARLIEADPWMVSTFVPSPLGLDGSHSAHCTHSFSDHVPSAVERVCPQKYSGQNVG